MTYLDLMLAISKLTEDDQKKPVICFDITTGRATTAVKLGETNHDGETYEQVPFNYGDPIIVH